MARKKDSKKIGDTIDIPDQGNIKPGDIKAKLSEIDGSFHQTTKAAAPIGLAVGAGAAVVLVLVVFALGKRRGRKRSTVVEIRRI
ncbi:MAG: hypothetical protein NVS3B12_14770 [Acidimicrobiales bacterium]